MVNGRDRSLQVQRSFLEFLKFIIGRNRILLSFLAGLSFLYFATPTPASILVGVPFVLIGEIIRTWASGFIKKGTELAQEGPYSFTRNPLYLGNFFIGLGFSLMTGNFYLLALFLTVFCLLYTVTIKNEEKRLLRKFGETFLVYKRSVPVFFPRLSFPRFAMRDFDWRLVRRHREHHTWLGIAGCLILFIFKLSYF